MIYLKNSLIPNLLKHVKNNVKSIKITLKLASHQDDCTQFTSINLDSSIIIIILKSQLLTPIGSLHFGINGNSVIYNNLSSQIATHFWIHLPK